MADDTCRVDGCERRVRCKALCGAHYQRWKKGCSEEQLSAPIKPRASRRSPTCTVDGCERKTAAWDLCAMHYYRLREHGDVGGAEPIRGARTECAVTGCGKKPHSRGLCAMHYQRQRTTGATGGADLERVPNGSYLHAECSIDWCHRPAKARGLCGGHYRRKLNGLDMDAPFRKTNHDRVVRKNGYAWVRADGSDWRLEHRVVLERVLGRPLRDCENVHHVNGVRDDNRPENLELWVKPQPAGQRAVDLAEWVVETYPELVVEAAERMRQPQR